jgi:hypothetical protein
VAETVIGIGTGRSGTSSLAALLDAQPGASVSHETPRVLPWEVDVGLLAQRLAELDERPGWLRGDVAFSYLPYVPLLLAGGGDVRVVCVLRDRATTVQSYLVWVGRRNHWIAHDGTQWELDPDWDGAYPTYEIEDRAEAIGHYWDEYERTVRDLAATHPDHVRLWWLPHAFTEDGIEEILDFVGVAPRQRVRTVNLQRNSRADRRA